MHGQSSLSVGLVLIVTGSLLASMCGFMVGRRAFRINVLWGVACFLIPGITLIVPFFAWRELRGYFCMQIAGVAVLLAGVALVFLDPETRSGIKSAMDERAQVAALMGDEEPDGVPPAPQPSSLERLMQNLGLLPMEEPGPRMLAKPAPVPPQPPKGSAAALEKKPDLQALYNTLQTRYSELQKKRPEPGAKPEEVRAFNKESTEYQTLLNQYKVESATLQKQSVK